MADGPFGGEIPELAAIVAGVHVRNPGRVTGIFERGIELAREVEEIKRRERKGNRDGC